MNPKDKMGAKKPNLSVLPFAPLLEVVPALYEGRRKYGPWNWRAEKVSETIYADAAIRHLMFFIAGEDIDPESGVHHIAKAIAGLLVVRDAQLHGCSIDDRMVDQNLNLRGIMEMLAGVNERYPEPVESDLPPRDKGVTGGETMTPEDARKVIEHIYKQDCSKWSATVAGDGPYVLTIDDVGKEVVLRDGTQGKIVQWFEVCDDEENTYPVNVRLDDGTEFGYEESYTPDGYEYVTGNCNEQDIVKVIHE